MTVPDAKRLLDIAVAGAGLVLTAPVALAVAVAVRREDGGPVLFTQERVGAGGRHFRIHKFRTMRAAGGGPAVSGSDDVRVTRVGRLLRRTKLDELPQLYDVLRGEMSLVGPRPEVPEFVALWPAELAPVILSVRPGITDPASVAYRHEADELAAAPDAYRHYVDVILPRKARMYADYVRGRSLSGDMRVVGQTVRAVLLD
ncbi:MULTISPECIES: sugar transferase [Arsenicicoccus]|uniref:sugar transferase n=1 Tax=Arsenicicoccus TaxID=267408 RepID=UPI00257F1428|nr:MULTISPECIES: sugar transferase [Arsenicicoccus]